MTKQQDIKTLVEEMVARVLSENCVSFPQARTEIENIIGTRPDLTTMHRWRKRGLGGVRLDCARIGRAYYTSIQAINRFIVARSSN